MNKFLLIAGLFYVTPMHVNADSTADLIAIDSAFSQMSVEKGVQAAFNHYLADDAVKLDGGAHAHYGRSAIVQTLPALSPNVQLVWSPVQGTVAKSGDLGYTWGTYILTITRDGRENHSYGKYTTIWSKETGEWKAILDMGNTSPGPASEN